MIIVCMAKKIWRDMTYETKTGIALCGYLVFCFTLGFILRDVFKENWLVLGFFILVWLLALVLFVLLAFAALKTIGNAIKYIKGVYKDCSR